MARLSVPGVSPAPPVLCSGVGAESASCLLGQGAEGRCAAAGRSRRLASGSDLHPGQQGGPKERLVCMTKLDADRRPRRTGVSWSEEEPSNVSR